MGRGNYKKKAPVIQEEIKDEEVVESIEAEVCDEAPAAEVIEPEVEVVVEEQVLEPAPEPEELPLPLYVVRVNHPSLRRRSEPSMDGEVLGLITDKGLYNIYAEVGEWGRLADDSWINLQFVSKQKIRQ